MPKDLKSSKQQIIDLAKGVIAPQDLRIGGDLRAEAASSVINMIVKREFLNKITTERMTQLSKEIEVFDMLPRRLVRVAQGAEPSDDDKTNLAEFGCVMTSQPVQLFADVKLDTLRDNANNPQLLSMLNGMFTTTFQNDLTDLGLNGVADGAVGSSFLNLCKGWWQVASEDTNTKTATIVPTDSWVDNLAKIRNAADERYEEGAEFLMNPKDALAYALEINKQIITSAKIATTDAYDFLGQKIIPITYMPKNKVMYTNLKNLVLGLNTVIRRDVNWHPTKRVLQFVFDWAIDYQIKVKHGVVLAETA